MTKRYWWIIITYIIMQFSTAIFIFFPDIAIETVIYYSIFSFIICLVIVLFLLKPDMKRGSARDAVGVKMIVIWSVIGVVMAFFGQGIAAVIEASLFGIQPGSKNTFNLMNIARTIPLFMIVPTLIAPVLEEIIFRKIIFGSLYKRTNFFIAALLSAVIFGIIHQELEHILVYTSMGLVFAFLYVKTKRILVPIIVHMAMNSIVVFAQYNLSPEDIEKMQQQLNQMQMIVIGG